jgi:hypothetical protein
LLGFRHGVECMVTCFFFWVFQTKKRLRKQIAAKDEEVQNLGMAVETAMGDIKHIKEKVRQLGFGLATLASHRKTILWVFL